MNIQPAQLERLSQWISAQGLSGVAATEMQDRCLESLERHAFMLILQDFDREAQDIYNDTLELDGAVEGFGFLKGLYGEQEALRKIQDAFGQALDLLISSK